LVLVVLALIWAIALLPPIIRSRMEGNPADSVGRFNRHLSVIRSTSPAASALAGSAYGPMPRAWIEEARRLGIQRRRRQVVKTMLTVSALTLLAGLIPDLRMLLVVHVAVDIALLAYVYKLAGARRAERIRKATTFTPRETTTVAEADELQSQSAAL
jgi:hypothetical protein